MNSVPQQNNLYFFPGFLTNLAFGDEESALLNLVIELIEKKLHEYRMVIQTLEDKYCQNFDQFTQAIQYKATFENEED